MTSLPRVGHLLLLLTGAAMLAGCSALSAFDTLAPRDPGGRIAAKSVAYGAHPRQKLDVFVPVAAAPNAPVLVFFYGGSWKNGTKDDYEFVGQALAAQGFVTVVADYRLVPEARYTDFLADGAGAVRWACDNATSYGGDGSRILLAGHSAGAYNAAMVALDPRYLRQAGVNPRNIRAFAGLSGPYDFLPLDPGTAQEVFGAEPDKPATQPISFVRPSSPPAFLATGDQDTTVRPKNTVALAAKLRAAGVPVEEHIYPGLDHADTLLALSRPFRGKAPELAEMTAFLKRHAGEAAGPNRTLGAMR
jgi:acetyl esterase/lipase